LVFDASTETPPQSIDLARRYAYPEIAPAGRRCYLRANMICSVDGASARDGHPAGLSAAGDTPCSPPCAASVTWRWWGHTP
jgi:hypothetical protein